MAHIQHHGRNRQRSITRFFKRLTLAQVLALALGVSIVLCIAWAGGLVLLSAVGSTVAENGNWDVWSILEGASSAAAFAIAVGGGLMILSQLSEDLENRQFAAFKDTFEKLMSEEEIEARRWIYQNIKYSTDPTDTIFYLSENADQPRPVPDSAEMAAIMQHISQSEKGQQHVKRVLNSLDYLAFLVEQNWIIGDEVIDWVTPVVVKSWDRLEHVVHYEMQRRGDDQYYRLVGVLAETCIQASRRQRQRGTGPVEGGKWLDADAL
ncbi:MAG: hypothetical protein GYB68_06745 [Chloroflexi bacterium]|nr:hypothetical protein [Chloroflexota bacterium]